MNGVEFYKMCGAGNDFVVIDNRDNILTGNLNEIAEKLCIRKFGIGSDGMILVEKSDIVDFKMRFFNPDGSEVEMCGNGARCIALFAYDNNIVGKDMVFETIAGNIEAHVTGEELVKIKLSEPHSLMLDKDVLYKDENLKINFINTGVPHVVIFVDDLENIDLDGIGSSIRYHDIFKPDGTNVNFVSLKDDSKINIRTYERGVEGETLACGTGSVAGALISSIKNEYSSPVIVVTKSGVELNIYFDKKDNNEFENVYLEGEARIVYKGQV